MADGFLCGNHGVSDHAGSQEETGREGSGCGNEFLGLTARKLNKIILVQAWTRIIFCLEPISPSMDSIGSDQDKFLYYQNDSPLDL